MVSVRLLGAVQVHDAAGRDVAELLKRPKRISVLAYLAAAQPYGFHRRDKLLGLFWAEAPQDRARKALNQALFVLRQELGKDAILSRGGGEVALDPEAFSVDVRAFDQAVGAGDFERALERYNGEFLDGFYISGAPEFERWADEERTRLRQEAVKSAFALVQQYSEAGDYLAAVERARWAARIAPADETLFRRLLRLLDEHGDRASALREYGAFARRLSETFGLDPSPETKALVERIRLRETPAPSPSTSGTRPPQRDSTSGLEGGVESPSEVSARDRLEERVSHALQDRYRVERKVGSGGMSVVFLARDLANDRNVAIKVLRPDLAESIGIDRFLREIQIARSLEHPNIVPIYASGNADGLPYYVMPYIDGESLRERLQREPQLQIDEAIRITVDVAGALDAAHQQAVVHRDIKPANILLSGPRVMVSDFGVAHALTEAGAARFTATGVAIGTPGYMSPEQATAAPGVDGRSDQYSLACVLYEMLAGEMVFTGPSARAINAKHVAAPPTPVRTLRPRVPVAVEQAILRALEKPAVDRFPSAGEFAAALQRGRQSMPLRPVARIRNQVVHTVRTHPVAGSSGLLAAVLAGVLAGKAIVQSDAPPWIDGRPASVVVVPYHTSTSSEDERLLADELADEVTRELNSWESIRAVPSVSLSGPMFDLGLDGPTLERTNHGVELAKAVSAQALVAVILNLRGDSAYAEAAIFNAANGREVGDPLQAAARVDEITTLTASLACGILGIEGVPCAPSELRRLTGNPAALAADVRGMRRLERWNLLEAERSFRQAIGLDTGFAMALNHLAQTLYWQTAAAPGSRLAELGPEISRWSTAAMERSGGLPLLDSLHIRGFFVFQRGDYQEARSVYQAILHADTTDVYAWLMLGTVEYQDRWLERTSDGSLSPRSDLNIARAAFAEATRLQPRFDLGYGHYFDIYTLVENVVRETCEGYEMPREELLAPWEPTTPHQARPFCPVVTVSDSIVWVATASLDTLDRSVLQGGVDRFFGRALGLIRRWAAYAPELARPREQMVAALLSRRRRLEISEPERLEAMADSAVAYAAQALALKRDTLPSDLLQLAGLYLGAARVQEALGLADEVLRRRREGPSATTAITGTTANVFLVTGHPLMALDLMSELNRRSWYVPYQSGDTTAVVSYGGGERILDRIRVLGATGVGGPALARELDALEQLWSGPAYSDLQRDLLRRHAAPYLSVALALSPPALNQWVDGLALDEPLWQALLLSERNPDLARVHLLQSMDSDALVRSGAAQAFLQAVTASRVGDHQIAASLFSRLDSIPLRLDGLDYGWGLRALSHFLRAQEYEAIDDQEAALEHYVRFTEFWSSADSLSSPLVEEAQSRIQRLRVERE